MTRKKYLGLLAILPLGLLVGSPFLIGEIDADADKNSETECRAEMILFHRTTGNDFVCLSIETAENWEKLGIGEMVGEPIIEKTMEESSEENMMEDEMTVETMMKSTEIPGVFQERNKIFTINPHSCKGIKVYNERLVKEKDKE